VIGGSRPKTRRLPVYTSKPSPQNTRNTRIHIIFCMTDKDIKNIEELIKSTDSRLTALYMDVKAIAKEVLADIFGTLFENMDMYMDKCTEIADIIDIVTNIIEHRRWNRYLQSDLSFLPTIFRFTDDNGHAHPYLPHMNTLGIKESILQVMKDAYPDYSFYDTTPIKDKHLKMSLKIVFDKNSPNHANVQSRKRKRLMWWEPRYDIPSVYASNASTSYTPASPRYSPSSPPPQ